MRRKFVSGGEELETDFILLLVFELQHPTIPGAWKFNGRLDDTLVMLTGEKTNPVPMEGESSPNLLSSPHASTDFNLPYSLSLLQVPFEAPPLTSPTPSSSVKVAPKPELSSSSPNKPQLSTFLEQLSSTSSLPPSHKPTLPLLLTPNSPLKLSSSSPSPPSSLEPTKDLSFVPSATSCSRA